MAKKWTRGEPLKIPAADLNEFAEVAERVLGGGQDRAKRGASWLRDPTVVDIKNTSGGDRARGDVLGLGDLVYTFADNAQGAKNRPIIKGATPDLSSHAGGRFAVLLGPVEADAIAQAVTAGLVAVQVDIKTDGDRFADIDDGEAGNLNSNNTGGPAAIVYVASSGTGVKWAIVDLGVGICAGFWAKLTSSVEDGTDTDSYKYAWSELDLDAAGYNQWSTRSGGRSGTTTSKAARNTVDLVGATYGAIPDDTIVWMREVILSSSVEYWFSYEIAPPAGFWAAIGTSAADGTNRNKYAWTEQEKSDAGYGGWSTLSGGRSGTTGTDPARNTIEDMNGSSGLLGCGVDVDNLTETDVYTYTLSPAPSGAIVWMREVDQDGDVEYWFAYENGVDGTCDEAE
jgi:hypothetical protein